PTDAPPPANPPMQRNATNSASVGAEALPAADTKYNTASTNSTRRRPRISAGFPAVNAPTIVPMSAEATAKPRRKLSSANARWSASVVPEMTAVSNPNSRPPRAATSALKTTGLRDLTAVDLGWEEASAERLAAALQTIATKWG